MDITWRPTRVSVHISGITRWIFIGAKILFSTAFVEKSETLILYPIYVLCITVFMILKKVVNMPELSHYAYSS
jgi:hypothetical protein